MGLTQGEAVIGVEGGMGLMGGKGNEGIRTLSASRAHVTLATVNRHSFARKNYLSSHNSSHLDFWYVHSYYINEPLHRV